MENFFSFPMQAALGLYTLRLPDDFSDSCQTEETPPEESTGVGSDHDTVEEEKSNEENSL